MTSTATRRTRPSDARPAAGRVFVALAAIVTAVLVGIVSLFASPASASSLSHARNGVGVIHFADGQRVGPHEQKLPGQPRERAPGYDSFVVGSGVGAETAGGLRVVGSGFSASEQSAAEALAGQGRNVVLREATGVGRTSDLLVDGVPYDVYTPTTGNLDRIVSAIASKGSQVNGGGVVLDLSKSPLTGVEPAALLARVQGVTPNISNIIILGG